MSSSPAQQSWEACVSAVSLRLQPLQSRAAHILPAFDSDTQWQGRGPVLIPCYLELQVLRCFSGILHRAWVKGKTCSKST